MLAVLSGIAQSASKFAADIRLLQHLKEIEEPFENIKLVLPLWRIREIQCAQSV